MSLPGRTRGSTARSRTALAPLAVVASLTLAVLTLADQYAELPAAAAAFAMAGWLLTLGHRPRRASTLRRPPDRGGQESALGR